jgi:glycosyltransferase involved in cell wall biosynthesis
MGASALAVTLDVGPAVHQRAGLSRYSERLAAHLLADQAAAVQVNLFYNMHSGRLLPASLRQAPVRTIRLNQYSWRLGVLATQWLRAPLLEGFLPRGGLYHATEHLLPYLRRPTVLTVHDLIFERYPEHHTRRNRLFLKAAMPLFTRAASAIIAVSQQTKRDITALYSIPDEKVQVIYQGIDPAFAPASENEVARVRQRYSPVADEQSFRPYLLMVGTLEPRKNHAVAMYALARLKAAGFLHRLLIVGGEGWLFAPALALVDQLGLGADVSFAGYVPFVDLPALYSGADCVLAPSLYEGFGFPVAEAMACGAPVVCSNSSSLPEVTGEAALLVPPTDDEALAAALTRVLNEPGLAASLRVRGQRQAARFRWEECAAATVALYQKLAARYSHWQR